MDKVFHIGLFKTATTYLQSSVFPYFEGINYLGSDASLYYLISHPLPTNKLLVSNERISGKPWSKKTGVFGHEKSWLDQFHHNVKNLSLLEPNAKVILGVRSHKDLIISNYKQYIHKGGCCDFNNFFDIYKNEGVVGIRDLDLSGRIQYLTKLFPSENIFVYTQEEIQDHFGRFLNDLSHFLETSIETKNLTKSKKNVGVSDFQLNLLRKFNCFEQKLKGIGINSPLTNKVTKKLKVYPENIIRNWVPKFGSDIRFISKEEEEFLLEHFRNDWETTLNFIDGLRKNTRRV